MALKTKEEKAPSQPDTMVLELALYNVYSLENRTYHKGTAYRFNRDVALRLLEEEDAGRRVWKQHRPVKIEVKKEPIEDVTKVQIVDATEPIHGLDEKKAPKGIQVGSDDEISDILNREDDITV